MPTVVVDSSIVKFLKEEQIWDIFVKNVKNDIDNNNLKVKRYISWFPAAFDWKSTPEGYDFWNSVNEKYYKKLKKV